MDLSYTKLYPMGNSTVLIDCLDGEVPRDMFKTVAAVVMQEKYLPCEQVGFICKARHPEHAYRLEMMGGELCVNALRTLAYLYFRRTGERSFVLESSGSDQSFQMAITPEDSVSLQFKMNIQHIPLGGDLGLVQLQGISHFVEEFPSLDLTTPELIMKRHAALCEKYAEYLKHVEAIGYVPYDKRDMIKIVPLVYVPETNTKIFESACGSGTIAVSIHEHILSKGVDEFSIQQPSLAAFKLQVQETTPNVYDVHLTSDVELISQGKIFIAERDMPGSAGLPGSGS